MQADSRDQHGVESLPFLKRDLRGLYPALPENILHYLNEIQYAALNSLEAFGWQLAFVRRSLQLPPIIVVKHDIDNKYAVLEEDGSMNLSPAVAWRH